MIKKSGAKLALVLFSILFLTSCISVGSVEVRLTIDVEKSGSGMVSVAIGMTPDTKSLLTSWGGQSVQEILEEEFPSEGYEMTIHQWADGEYEWIEGSIPFETLEELNHHIASNEIISQFSLIRQRKVVKDQFILDAEMAPVGTDFVDMILVVNLPGDVIQTNGIFQGEGINTIYWRLNESQPTIISAISETVSYVNIGIIAVTSCAIGIVLLLSIIFLSTRKKKSGKKERLGKPKSNETEKSTATAITNHKNEVTFIEELDHRSQVKVMKDLSREPG